MGKGDAPGTSTAVGTVGHPMGPKHDKATLLAAARSVVARDGLARLSFGRVAAHAETSDRVVVYYFANKEQLAVEVLESIGADLMATLGAAFTEGAVDHREMAAVAWPALTTPEADDVFALYFEAVGLASAGVAPYDSTLPVMMDAWVQWLAGFFADATPDPVAEAEATVAVIDGLLLLRRMNGAAAADRAAASLGVG